MQIKGDIISHLSKCQSLRRQNITHVADNVEKPLLVGVKIGSANMDINVEVPQIKIELPYDLTILLLGIY